MLPPPRKSVATPEEKAFLVNVAMRARLPAQSNSCGKTVVFLGTATPWRWALPRFPISGL
jgi:hypothetical protein